MSDDSSHNLIRDIPPSGEYIAARPLTDYFDPLVRINLENLKEYYQVVKKHVDKSFRASLAVGIAGFALICAGMVWTVIRGGQDRSLTFLSGIAGVVTEFISAVFFYLYNRTVRQMKEYHDSLLGVQNVLLCLKVVGDTGDPVQRDRMLETTLKYLVGRNAGTLVRSQDPGASQAGST